MRPAFLLLLAFNSVALAAEVDYARQVKPLLSERCYTCHAALKQESGLRLDTGASIIKGGDSGAIVSPGKSGESELIARVTHSDPDIRMPPEGEGSPLTGDEVALLKAWIDQGAKGPADERPEADPRDHWSFRAVVRPEIPTLQNAPGARLNAIDAFLAAEREQHGLVAQPPADKHILLRRVYLDLVGLPPTAEQIEAFVADDSDDAYEQVVNRLLDSPQYGERWGRHWMDVWRYSDWWGLGAEVRNSQKHIWHWRDWIVESLNADAGYDEMVRQMLAADELYPNDLDKLRATGFLVRHYFIFNRNTWLEETVEHTSKAFLGMTFNCARCHDHKYDPISQKNYYRFRAFFEPYQVRMEQVPGQSDYEQDGIPRVFDCNLDAPTYRFFRGDEKRPVKEEPLSPDLPALLSFEELKIEPIGLPREAHQPGLRPWVLENHLQAARREITAAKEAVDKAKKALAEIEEKARQAPRPASEPAESAESSQPLVSDDFSAEQADVWEIKSGEWKYEESKLVQRAEGDVRGVLALKAESPRDFVVRFRFSPTGGKQWKSVGLSFDLTEESDTLVYLSAYAGGPKLQISYKQNGNYIYPAEGTQARDVKLGQPQDVVIRVRDKLINVEIGGKHALAYRLPVGRQKGQIALVTYDAQAEFHQFELSPLAESVRLQEPAKAAANVALSVDQAKAALIVAEKALVAVQLQPDLFRARASADQAKFQEPRTSGADDLVRTAALCERKYEHAKAEEALAKGELELLKAEANKKAEAEKKVTAAREAVAKAAKAVESPGEEYTPFRGARKTKESNVESDASYNRLFPATSTGRRTSLARWITDRRHPLTARVAANHIWLRHMGAPLVPTVFEFGRKGLPPTHPALLDYLAAELMDHNWSMKHLHRLIVTSHAYRMTSSSKDAEANAKIDPENRYYWRMNAGRMESQVVRDALLHLGGELDPAIGGPSVPLGETERSKRRSLYFVHSHNEHSRLLSIFDDANVLDCYRREQSIVPQQALALNNSRLALESAQKIAARIQSGASIEDAEFIRRAFVLLLAGEPQEEELSACQDALAGWTKAGLDRNRARANLVQSLLNHNDFITVR